MSGLNRYLAASFLRHGLIIHAVNKGPEWPFATVSLVSGSHAATISMSQIPEFAEASRAGIKAPERVVKALRNCARHARTEHYVPSDRCFASVCMWTWHGESRVYEELEEWQD